MSSAIAIAASNQGIAYQGRILKPDGTAVNSGNVGFTLSIYSSGNEHCLLYREIQTVDMTNSQGVFSLTIGEGTRTDSYSGGTYTGTNSIDLNRVFMNAGTISAAGNLTCTSGTTYSPLATDDRKLVVSFYDGSQTVSLSPMRIKSVPFALQANEVGGYGSGNLAKISGAGSNTAFSPNEYEFIKKLALPASATNDPCANGEILKKSGGVWICASDATGGSPTDSNYGTKGVVEFDTSAATSGMTYTASGIAKVNMGTGANQIPQLDGSGKLNTSVIPNLAALTLKDGDTNTITLQTAADVTPANYTLTLPAAAPTTNGEVLTFTTAGVGSWSTMTASETDPQVGTNTTNYLSKWDGSALVASGVFENGTGVGIGTATPAYPLDVNGSGRIAGATIIGQTMYGLTRISTGGGLELQETSATNPLLFSTNSLERMRIDSSGNVGIGTTTPAATLDVTGTLSVNGYGGVLYTTSGTGASHAGTALYVSSLAGYTGSGRNASFQVAQLAAGTGNNLRLSWAGTRPEGNVAAHIYSQAVTTGANIGGYYEASNAALNIGLSSKATTVVNGGTNIGVLGVGLNTGTTPTSIGGYFGLLNVTPAWTSAALIADNGTVSAPIFIARDNGTAVFTIDDGGKVGINTTAPNAKLHINGDLQFTNGGATAVTCSVVGDTGKMRTEAGTLEFCDGTAWRGLATSSYSPSNFVVTSGNQSIAGTKTFTGSIEVGTVGSGAVLTNTGSTLNISNGVNISGGPSTIAGNVNFDSNTMFVDATNNKVGIGTAAPAESLDVAGNINFTGVIKKSTTRVFDADVAGANFNTYIGSGTAAIGNGSGYSTAVGYNSLALNTGTQNTAVGAYALWQTTGGYNTAIGTGALQNSSTSTYNTALGRSALKTLTSGSIGNTAMGEQAGYDVTTGSYNILIGYYNSMGVGVTTGSNNIIMGKDVRPPSQTADNQLNIGNLIYATGLASGATASTGNVGIGTSSPSTSLDTFKSSTATLANMQSTVSAHSLALSSEAYTAGNYLPGLAWYTSDSPTKPKSAIWSYGDINGSKIFLGTTNSYGAGVTNTAMVIDANGKVGLGAASSGAKLDVNGSSQMTPLLAVRGGGNNIEFGHNNSAGYGSTIGALSASGWPFVAFNAEVGTAGNTFKTRGFQGRVIIAPINGALKFSRATNSNADNQSLTDDVIIDASGNVGVGTTSPSEKLQVNSGNLRVVAGQAYVDPQASSGASPLSFDTNQGNMMTWNTNDANPIVNLNNMKAGASYVLILRGTGTGAPTINCWSGVGVGGITTSALPALNTRTVNATIYNILTDGTHCYITWATGFP